jgi:hypothetical protein
MIELHTGTGISYVYVLAGVGVRFGWIGLVKLRLVLSAPRSMTTFTSKSQDANAIFKIPMLGSVGTICA